MLDPVGFRQLLNYLYKVSGLLACGTNRLPAASTEIPNTHLVCSPFPGISLGVEIKSTV